MGDYLPPFIWKSKYNINGKKEKEKSTYLIYECSLVECNLTFSEESGWLGSVYKDIVLR